MKVLAHFPELLQSTTHYVGGGVMLFCVRLKKAICEFRVVMTNQLGAT